MKFVRQPLTIHVTNRKIVNNGKQRGEAQARRNAAEHYTRDHLQPIELRFQNQRSQKLVTESERRFKNAYSKSLKSSKSLRYS